MWSAAGPSASAAFVAPLSTPGVAFGDEVFRPAARWRLGLPAHHPPGQPCAILNGAASAACGLPMDVEGDHAASCPCGRWSVLRHEALADRWADVMEEAGATVRREIYVRELSTPAVEAWLDVGTYGIPVLENCLFDVTCRHANDPRYQPGAAHVPGHTSQKATDEKHLRYYCRYY